MRERERETGQRGKHGEVRAPGKKKTVEIRCVYLRMWMCVECLLTLESSVSHV